MALFEKEPEDLNQAVHVAVGAASVCWEDMSGTGVFQDDRAREVAQGLIDYIEANYVPVPEDRPAPSFEEDLRSLLNKHSIDAKTNTPDNELTLMVVRFLGGVRNGADYGATTTVDNAIDNPDILGDLNKPRDY